MILINHRMIIDFSALHTDVEQVKEQLTNYRTELAQLSLAGHLIDEKFKNHSSF